MISQDLASELHDQLVSERERLQQEIGTLSNTGIHADVLQADETDGVDQHPADEGTELFEREKNLTLQRTLETSLHLVDDALGRFDQGTYGLCEHCGKPIPEKRLRALPSANHCIECQSALDRQAVRR